MGSTGLGESGQAISLLGGGEGVPNRASRLRAWRKESGADGKRDTATGESSMRPGQAEPCCVQLQQDSTHGSAGR